MKDNLIIFGLIILLLISVAAYGCGLWYLIFAIFTHQDLVVRVVCFLVGVFIEGLQPVNSYIEDYEK